MDVQLKCSVCDFQLDIEKLNNKVSEKILVIKEKCKARRKTYYSHSMIKLGIVSNLDKTKM